MRTYTPEQRARHNATSLAYYHRNRETILERLRSRPPEVRAALQAKRRERYATDEAERERVKQASAAWRADPANRSKIAEYQQRYQASERGQEVKRRDRLQRYFGLTVEQYDAMFTAQGGVCAICRQPETRKHRGRGRVVSLAVDHDHKCCPLRSKTCGKCVRGLLCDRCNLGRWPDDPALLRAAADYFERYQT